MGDIKYLLLICTIPNTHIGKHLKSHHYIKIIYIKLKINASKHVCAKNFSKIGQSFSVDEMLLSNIRVYMRAEMDLSFLAMVLAWHKKLHRNIFLHIVSLKYG